MASIITSSQNKDIDYIQKDFSSAVDAVINFANVNFGSGTSANRLWTSFNVDSFSRNWLEIVAFIADVFFFYFDNQATQSYLQTATVRSAVQDIAQQFGFVPATATSASGIATFTVNAAGTILRGFRVSSSDGQKFYLTNDIVASAAGTYLGTVLQGSIVTEGFVSTGLQNEQFNLTGPNVIVDKTNLNPQDITPLVSVNGNSYTLVDSLILQNGTDTPVIKDSLGNVIGGGGRAFLLSERPDGTPYITFGDGIFGRKLSTGETVSIIYRTGGGSLGNIGAQTLTTLVDSNPIVSSVINAAQFSGGADEQSIDQLRDLIPSSLRTLERAVAISDYSDLLKANFTSVFDASAEASTQAGIDLNIYVIPQGNGITQISQNIILKNSLFSFLDRRKTVTVQFQILDAFGVDVLVTLNVFISDTASKSTVRQAIITALEDYFDLRTGGVSGSGIGFATEILLKDINNLVENVSGVSRFEITQLTYRPRIQMNIVGLLTTYEASNVTVFPNVSKAEWLLGAGAAVTRTAGNTLFSNTSLVSFTYNSVSGLIHYNFPVDLTEAAPGDTFKDGAGTSFTILGVDIVNYELYLSTGLTVNTTVSNATHGSILSGATTYQSFKVFKKIRANATNLTVNSITDNNLDLSVLKSTGNALGPRLLLDNNMVFINGQYADGNFYLVDSASNIWEIEQNDSNTLTTSIAAVNDAAVTSVASGEYKIVQKLIGHQVTFAHSIFSIEFNSDNTVFSTGAEFSQIGTIGDLFEISKLQGNLGNMGSALNLLAYDPGTGNIRLNSGPDLSGIGSNYFIIDSSGQIFKVVAVDNRPRPSVFFSSANQDSSFILKASGLGSQYAEGFKVPSTDVYAVVSFNLERQGNILGNLTAKIVNDSAGLPNLGSVVATSLPVQISSLPSDLFTKVNFTFTVPPTLTAATQYHLVISGDSGYVSSEQDNILEFSNTGLVGFNYNIVSGAITYVSSVNLATVVPGNYFRDNSDVYYPITAVDAGTNTVTIEPGLAVDNTVNSIDDGAIYAYDDIRIGVHSLSPPSYPDGEFSRYNGVSWSNSVSGPDQFASKIVAVFSAEGTKTITIESNLTPVLGTGATISPRYYDDNNEISFILGLSNGSPTFAADVNALGVGTIASVVNSRVDTFVFRTSPYSDDIVNLRLNEVPQIKASDINLNIFGGVD